MSLTAEQVAIRRTGIGASEVAEVVEMHPYRGRIDTWLEKTGRAAARPETPQSEIGFFFESQLLALYSRRTGIKLRRPRVTLRHPEFQRMLASPDALGRKEDIGVEGKVVGSRMAHHWAEDTFPDYVRLQCLQNMAVTGRSAWDIVALVGGTDLRVYRVERDRDTESLLAESIDLFWNDHVENDVAPTVQDPEQRRRYLRTRYPGSEATKCRSVEDERVASAAARIRDIKSSVKALEAEKEELTDGLCEIIGDDYGIEGAWGKALWYPVPGRVAWKELAEEMAGGAVDPALLEKHRGDKTRTAQLYEPKKRKK